MKRSILPSIFTLACLLCAARPPQQARGGEEGLAAAWKDFATGGAGSFAHMVAHRDSVAQGLGGDGQASLDNAALALYTAANACRNGTVADGDHAAMRELLRGVDMKNPAITDVPHFAGVVEGYYALEAILGGAPRKEAWGGMVFNTSVPTVSNAYDYYRYRRILEEGNDALTSAYLFPLLRGVFRYNGYTRGLDVLRPHIEKLMPEGEAKEELMTLYERYASTREGGPAADFRMEALGGTEYSLADFRGKVLVIDVWATWCAGCIAKFPDLLAMHGKYAGRDVEFITVSIDDANSRLLWKYSLPGHGLLPLKNLFADPDSTFKKDYNITGIPRYFVIDRDGRIVTLYAPAPGEALEKIIDEALNNVGSINLSNYFNTP